MKRNGILIFGVVVALLVSLMLMRLIPLPAAYTVNTTQLLRGPTFQHPLGTDDLGRDQLARSLVGLRNSLTIALLALFEAVILGLLCGSALAVWTEKWIQIPLRSIFDVMLSIPPILILLALLAVAGRGMVQAFIGVGLIGSALFARIFAAEASRLLLREDILAERVLGFSRIYVWSRIIMPYTLRAGLPYVIQYAADLIAIEAGLSFLGLSLQPPEPGLGSMLFESLTSCVTSPWLLVGPSIALTSVLVIFNICLRHIKDSTVEQQ